MSQVFEISSNGTINSKFGVVTTNNNKFKEDAENRRKLLLKEALAKGTPCEITNLMSNSDFIGLRAQCKIAFSRATRKIYSTSKKNFSNVLISRLSNSHSKIAKTGKPYVVIPPNSPESTAFAVSLSSWATSIFSPILNSVCGEQVKKMAVDFYGVVSAEDGSVLAFPENDPYFYEAPSPLLFCDSFSYQFEYDAEQKEYRCRVSFHIRVAGFAHVPPALESTPSF